LEKNADEIGDWKGNANNYKHNVKVKGKDVVTNRWMAMVVRMEWWRVAQSIDRLRLASP